MTAWNALPKDMIASSFKCCGISVALDGSEDELITCFKLPDLHGGLQFFKDACEADDATLEEPEPVHPHIELEDDDGEFDVNDDDVLVEELEGLAVGSEVVV